MTIFNLNKTLSNLKTSVRETALAASSASPLLFAQDVTFKPEKIQNKIEAPINGGRVPADKTVEKIKSDKKPKPFYKYSVIAAKDDCITYFKHGAGYQAQIALRDKYFYKNEVEDKRGEFLYWDARRGAAIDNFEKAEKVVKNKIDLKSDATLSDAAEAISNYFKIAGNYYSYEIDRVRLEQKATSACKGWQGIIDDYTKEEEQGSFL